MDILTPHAVESRLVHYKRLFHNQETREHAFFHRGAASGYIDALRDQGLITNEFHFELWTGIRNWKWVHPRA